MCKAMEEYGKRIDIKEKEESALKMIAGTASRAGGRIGSAAAGLIRLNSSGNVTSVW